ncbi:MAG TPA: hypothetical protein DCE65_06700 [Clostridiales bacterium]|nr:hypothetical protein [Clostridiales bacterium]
MYYYALLSRARLSEERFPLGNGAENWIRICGKAYFSRRFCRRTSVYPPIIAKRREKVKQRTRKK